MKLTLAFAAVALLAAPAFADEMKLDAMKMTCADMMAMDKDGMMMAGTAIKESMKDDAKMSAMSDEEVMMSAAESCKMHPDAGVMDAMKM